MFRATMYQSSGVFTVSMRDWCVSLFIGGVWSAGWSETPTSRPNATHTEWQTSVSHRYSKFSWWWVHGCPKHVEKRNKYTKQNCTPSWVYLQDCTRMHAQQNIKLTKYNLHARFEVLTVALLRHKSCGSWSCTVQRASPHVAEDRSASATPKSLAQLLYLAL